MKLAMCVVMMQALVLGLGCAVCGGVAGDMREGSCVGPCSRGLSSVYVCAHSPWGASLALAQCWALALPWGVFLGSAPHPAASHRVH